MKDKRKDEPTKQDLNTMIFSTLICFGFCFGAYKATGCYNNPELTVFHKMGFSVLWILGGGFGWIVILEIMLMIYGALFDKLGQRIPIILTLIGCLIYCGIKLFS